MAMDTSEVGLDSRGRVPLGRFATARRHRVERREDGEIVLTPVISLTTHEFATTNGPELMDRIKNGIRQMHEGQVGPSTPRPIVEDEG
jgi:hypothetical protein